MPFPTISIYDLAAGTDEAMHTVACRHCGAMISYYTVLPFCCRDCGGNPEEPAIHELLGVERGEDIGKPIRKLVAERDALLASSKDDSRLIDRIARALFAEAVNDEALRIAEGVPRGIGMLFSRDPSEVVAIMWNKTKLDVRKRCVERARVIVDAMNWEWWKS